MGKKPSPALTVEQAKRLPPPTPEEIEQRRVAIDRMLAIREEIRARLGRGLTEEEFWDLLDGDEDDNCE